MFTEISLEGRTGFGIRHYRAFDMTRDGFTLLAMGFTGEKALQRSEAPRQVSFGTGCWKRSGPIRR